MRKGKRRAVSVRGDTYDRLQAHAKKVGSTGSGLVEKWVNEALDKIESQKIYVDQCLGSGEPHPSSRARAAEVDRCPRCGKTVAVDKNTGHMLPHSNGTFETKRPRRRTDPVHTPVQASEPDLESGEIPQNLKL